MLPKRLQNEISYFKGLSILVVNILKGIASFSLGIYLWSVILSISYRFPIPLAGYIGPHREHKLGLLESFTSAALSFAFYTAVGGFIIIFIGGIAIGAFVKQRYPLDYSRNKYHLILGLFLGFFPAFTLAILDYIIGPW